MKERLPRPWRNGILVVALILNSVITCGQLKITGTINDSAKGPLAYASVKLLKDSSVLVQAVYSDSMGTFIFSAVAPGFYLVEGSYVGNKVRTGRFRLDHDTALVLFARSQPARVLKEVTVTAAKPMIERKIDRMVFNVESSLAARGTDLTEALAMTPLLRVDDNGVSIIGKSGVAVMINERILNLSGSDLINYLKSLRTDDIERIEVITAPPARYEAQGNSGLINIVLKKNPNIGWSGNISPSYTQASYSGYANNFNLNYQSHKLSSSLRVRQYDRMSHPTEDIDIIGTNSILSSDSRKDVSYGWGANLGVDYKLNEKSVIGFIYDISRPHYDIDITNSTTYQYNTITDSVLSTLSKQRNTTFTQTLSLYYDQKFGKSGAKLSNGFNFFSTMPGTTVDFQTRSDQSAEPDSVRNTSNQGYTIWSAQSDLSLPGKWALVETGLKYTNFDNNSATGYYNVVQQDYQEDSTKSNRFIFNEKNVAGYISSQKDFNKKWSVKAGLRYEYSIIDGHSPDSTGHNAFQYGKWFPTLYITYKPAKDHTFSFNYSKRINRPNFRQLSPFRWYSNPYSYYTGNPLLQPSYNHNVELAYLYKSIFSLTLYGQKLLNGYGGIVEVNGDHKVVVYENYLNRFNMGVEATFGLKIFPWWEHRDVMSFDYSHSSSSAPEVVPVQGFGFYYTTYNTFTVTHALSLLLNFSHSLPSNAGNVHNDAQYTLSSGARLALGKMQVNITLNDILKSAINRGIIYYQGYEQYFSEYYDYRRVGLAVTYTFGKTKVKGSSKQVNFKETQRAN